MEKECECYEEEVQPYRKTDYKPIIYIRMTVFGIRNDHLLFHLVTFRSTSPIPLHRRVQSFHRTSEQSWKGYA